MAKQTFTTGQVLTAAQMTDLQQTAMTGGAASTKTVSYVLVAADAGTRVAMDAAGSTTITVNTGLFSAGDTVSIQNIGAGVCTVTAGTATVNTSGSLVLAQYQGGILYFTSASTAIFFQFATPGLAFGNLAQIATGTLSGASLTVSSLSTYSTIFVHVFGTTNSTADGRNSLRVNNNSGGNYQQNQIWTVNDAGGVAQIGNPTANTEYQMQAVNGDRTAPVSAFFATLTNCKEPGFTAIESQAYTYTGSFNVLNVSRGIYKVSETVSSIVLFNTGGNWAGGTYYVWGA